MASSYHVFEAAAQIEEVCALIYREAARRFAGDEGVRALFARLEEEEEQHAMRVRLLAARYRGDPSRFDLAVMPRLQDLEALAEAANAEYAAFRNGEWPAELERVKAHLADLERRFAAMHAQFLAPGADPQVAAFFALLSEQDRAHDRLLSGS
ncbi:MAG TPA: hypothetical protein VFE30_05625 [Anaeromyxobacteraceae bacterium]|jgi:rubrerythrin|nr:hypothetical protein [Anaeromyxobacteraceae bacterium]